MTVKQPTSRVRSSAAEYIWFDQGAKSKIVGLKKDVPLRVPGPLRRTPDETHRLFARTPSP